MTDETNMPVENWIALPVEIKCIEWTGKNFHQIWEFCNGMARMDNGHLVIETTEGSVRVSNIGDCVVKGPTGSCYPCKPDHMELKYGRPRTKEQWDALNEAGSLYGPPGGSFEDEE